MTQKLAHTVLFTCIALFAVTGCTQDDGATLTRAPAPRGEARILYASDGNNIGRYILTNQPNDVLTTKLGGSAHSGRELRRHLDELADNGVDLFAQSIFTKYGLSWFQAEHPDHGHQPTGLDKIDPEDGTAIEIAIDQCHKRGMKFLAKFRMADRHGGTGRGLISKRQDLWNPDFPGVAAMDYTHQELRDWVFAAVEEILRRFDVDGFEFNYIRWMHTFPRDTARESHTIMTKFVRRTRERIDAEGKRRGRKLILGVRVPQTLEECHALGYDVPTWVRDGLVDYVAPCDFFFSDFNARFEDFAALMRGTDCMLYPTVHPLICKGADTQLMRPENYRAAARNMYAGGADGVSTFNYMYHWVGRRYESYPGPPGGYPTALAWLRQMRRPQDFESLPRRYLFYPLWSGHSPSGFPKNDRIVLERNVGSRGAYRFRIAEELSTPETRDASGSRPILSELIVTASKSALGDGFTFFVNGVAVNTEDVKDAWYAKGRPDKWSRATGPCWTYMLPLTSPPVVFGDNRLEVEVTALDEKAEDDIVIDEIEVTVVPPME